MKLTHPSSAVVVIILAALCGGAGVAVFARKADSDERDRTAIERLHRLDIETTLSDKADELTKLWDKDAVRIQPGSPADAVKVRAVRALRDDPLQSLRFSGLKQGIALSLHVLANAHIRQAAHDLGENLLAAQERLRAQIVAVQIEQIEYVIEE